MANQHIHPLSQIASSSTSPPSTPPQRSRKYPPLLTRGHPRHVPSRKGETSHTYERLEDLLRDAGYKETRIFTPEADRFPADGDKRGGSNPGGSKLGGVVGFFAGLIPGVVKQDESESEPAIVSAHTDSDAQPDSPLAYKFATSDSPHAKKFTISPISSINNISADPNLNNQSDSPRLKPNKQLYPHRTNLPSIRQQTSFSGRRPNPPTARALLRHISSVPSMPKGRDSGPSLFILNEPGAVDHHPPLPPTWLDSVKQAVSSSNTVGAHTGGPREHNSRSTRTQRKKENNSGFYAEPNTVRGRSSVRGHLAPPQPLTCLVASPGPVNMVSVVCRSAPGSRSSSLVRNPFERGVLDIGCLDQELKGKGKDRGRARKRPDQKQRDGVPSLIATGVGDIAWDGFIHSRKADHEEDEEDEDEEGELNLAKLLVPPKRQHSIQSLRRHLDKHSNSKVGKASGRAGLEPWRPEDDSEDGLSVRRGRRRPASPDEDWGVPGVKLRSGIPSDW